MSDAEFRAWLNDEVQHGRMSATARDDLLSQKDLFDFNKSQIRQDHPGQVVGYVADTCLIGRTVQEVQKQARSQHPGRLLYFEVINS